MTASARAVVASAIAVLLTSFALHPIYVDLHWLPATIGAVGVAGLIGLLARRSPVPVLATLVLAPVLGLGYLTVLYARTDALAGVIPTGASLRSLRLLFDVATSDIRTLAPPVPTHAGLVMIGAAGVLACAVAVDLFAVTLHRPAVAGLPLLALFAVPSGILSHGIGVVAFLTTAAGWLTLLLVEGRDRVGVWGRTLGRRTSTTEAGSRDRYTPSAVAITGRRIGSAAVGLAVALPLAVPPLHGGLLHPSGLTNGTGNRPTSTTVFPPVVTLERRLHSAATTTLLLVTSDAPTYLRMTALDVYDRGTFTLGQIGADTSGSVAHGLPAPPGPSDGAVFPVHAHIAVSRQLAEPYLPLPYAPHAVAVPGDWRTSAPTMTVFSNSITSRGLSYDVFSLVPIPDAQTLRDEGQVSDFPSLLPYAPDLALPVLDPAVRSLVDQVTARADTAYDKVLAIQDFLRGPSFRYDLNTTGFAASKDLDPLADFLLRSRRGYCEQFATAMAVMVRALGLPARVAIGFTSGTATSATSYVVTNHDAHAWPEVFFPRAGWVRFEPTPLDPTHISLPSYAGGVLPRRPVVTPTPSATAGPQPSGSPAPHPLTAAERADRAAIANAAGAAATSTTRALVTRAVLWTLLAVVIALGIGPGVVRAAVRRRRLAAAGDSRAAWLELLDTAEDLRLRLPVGASPRAVATALGRSLSGPDSRHALDRLAHAEERRRFAAAHLTGDSDNFGVEALLVRRGLLRAAGRAEAARATLAPPSQLRRLVSGAAERRADVAVAWDHLLNRLGAALRSIPAAAWRRLRRWGR